MTESTVVLDPTHASFAPGETVSDLGVTHFIGIGGAGMSVLAEMLHEEGVAVAGSDREESAKTDRLKELGIGVRIGQKAENVAGARTVVFSSAIKPDNPEIVAAAAAGERIVHRSDILALLLNAKRGVTVAGAHGKTTTSALLSHILVNAGTGDLADPSYAIGGSIQTPDGGVKDGGHAGRGGVLVAEADESDGSFEKYTPEIAIITNAEPDHLDHYGDAAHYHAAFVEHAGHARGHVVICGDDAGALDVIAQLPDDVAARTIVYTTAPADLPAAVSGRVEAVVAIDHEREAAESGTERFSIAIPAGLLDREAPASAPARIVPVSLVIPGIHNARNATAAILAAALLGMDPDVAAKAAADFRGAARRFQIRGVVEGVTVVDDYAHHPTEIAALLDAARRRYPGATLRVLFQPHLFSRTKFFAREFAEALSKADDVIVTCIFPAREKAEDFPGVGGQTVVDAAAGVAHDPQDDWIHAVPDMCQAAKMLCMRAHRGDVLFTVGAGDVTQMATVMLRVLEAHREMHQIHDSASSAERQ